MTETSGARALMRLPSGGTIGASVPARQELLRARRWLLRAVTMFLNHRMRCAGGGHGTHDPVVPESLGALSRDLVRATREPDM